MNSIVSTTVYDAQGVEIPVNSARAYEIVVEALVEIDRKLQDLDVVVPSVLRESFRAARDTLADVRRDGAQVLDDLQRWDGDHMKALSERQWRLDQKRRKR